MTQCAQNSHFIHTKWVIMMLVRLSLNLKLHILFLHMTIKVEICLVTEENGVQKVMMVFDLLTNCLSMTTSGENRSDIIMEYLESYEVGNFLFLSEMHQIPRAKISFLSLCHQRCVSYDQHLKSLCWCSCCTKFKTVSHGVVRRRSLRHNTVCVYRMCVSKPVQ